MSKRKYEKIRKDTIHLTKEYKELRDSLIKQLESDEKLNEQNIDLINQYMSFYVTKMLLNEDILERGVTVECYTARGDLNHKKNDSIAELTKVSAAMLRILQYLNISPQSLGDNDDM